VSTLVLDASVIIKWALADPRVEPHTDRALHLLESVQTGRVAIVEPAHWLAEVAAVLCRLVPRRARETVRLLEAMELPVSDHPDTFARACDLSIRLREHVFDTLYHAVALTHADATLVTADDRYYRRGSRVGRISRLADLSFAAS
jgi:predicted nucleic acid-binding protein